MEPRHPVARFAPYLLAAAAGGFIAWADAGASEPQPAAALILLFTAALGLARPAHAWRWALIVAGGIPFTATFGLLGANPTGDNSPFHLGLLLPLIPGLAGAYAGAAVGRLSNSNGATTGETRPARPASVTEG